MSHYDEMTFLQYLEGNLERARSLELSAHTQHCDACRALLGVLQRETHLLTHALREQDEAVPARLFNPVRERISWAWVLSFGMAAAGIYWFVTTYNQLSTGLTEAGIGKTDLMSTLFFNGVAMKGWSSMWTAAQWLAVVSLGVIGFMLVRKSMRRWNTIALVMSALVAALGMPLGAAAADIQKSEASYTLKAGETVKTDLIVFGNSIQIDGTVEGDLIVFGQNVTVNGHVMGDALVCASMLTVTANGTVDGSVRYAGGNFVLSGKVGRSMLVGTGTLTANPSSEVAWGLTFGAGNVFLNGRIGRDILGGGGHINLNGYVGGNIRLHGDAPVDIGSSTEVLGKIEVKGPKPPEIASGAKLASAPVFTLVKRDTDTFSSFSWWHKLLAWGASFVFGLVLVLLVPAFFDDTVRTANRFGVSLGVGLLLLAGIPLAALLACITIVGLSVGIPTIFLYLLLIYGGKVFVAAWLGRMLMGKDGFAGVMIGIGGQRVIKTPAILGHLAVGLAILYALRMIPYIGGWITFAVVVWGLGAVGVTVFKRLSSRSAPVTAPAPVTA
jgi:cytoskeletal protein CcmA (bactofilin family)